MMEALAKDPSIPLISAGFHTALNAGPPSESTRRSTVYPNGIMRRQVSARVPHFIDTWWKAFLVQGMPILILVSIFSVLEYNAYDDVKIAPTLSCVAGACVYAAISLNGLKETMLEHRDRLLDNAAAYQKAFTQFDIDRSNTLNATELMFALRALGQR
jgi:hypothetical protein